MKKIAWFIVMLAAPAFAQTAPVQGYCTLGATQATVSGIKSTNTLQGIVPKCTVSVYNTGTNVLANPIYSNGTGTVLTNPFTATTSGAWLFFASSGVGYDVVLSGGTAPNVYASPVTLTGVLPPVAGVDATARSAAATAQTSADSAQSSADSAQTTADAALPRTGGTLTGPLNGTSANFSGAVAAASENVSGTGTFAIVQTTNALVGPTQLTSQGRIAGVVQTVSAASLPHLMTKLRSALNPTINIALFGSSVMCGATLPDPTNQAPGVYFANSLKAKLDPWGNATWNVYNYCQNGSVIYSFTQSTASGYTEPAWQTMLNAGVTPDVVFFGYGMNDGQPASFNAGETRTGFQSALQQAIITVQQKGADLVIATTPHPAVATEQNLRGGAFWTVPASVDQAYPTFIAKPVSAAATSPAYPGTGNNTALVTADSIGNSGPSVIVDRRFTIINNDMRAIAADAGVPVVDAEKYSIRCTQQYIQSAGSQIAAEAVLFNSGQIVHPNLTGDQCSYYPAADDFAAAIGRQVSQPGTSGYRRGYVQTNGDAGQITPSLAVQDIYPPYPDMTTKPWSVKARTGSADGAGVKATQEAAYIDPATGDLVTAFGTQEGYRFHGPTTYGTGSVETIPSYAGVPSEVQTVTRSAQNNVGAAATFNITVVNGSAGRVRISAMNNGTQNQVWDAIYSANDGGVCLGSPDILYPGASLFTITTSGLNIVVNNVFAATNYAVKLETETAGSTQTTVPTCPTTTGVLGTLLPRDANGAPTDAVSDLGSATNRWNAGWFAGNIQLQGHLNQKGGGNRIAGNCTMAAATSCTFTLGAAFNGTPVCIPAVQGATAIAAACGVSGTTVTITAASSNSQTWGAVLIGNPN